MIHDKMMRYAQETPAKSQANQTLLPLLFSELLFPHTRQQDQVRSFFPHTLLAIN